MNTTLDNCPSGRNTLGTFGKVMGLAMVGLGVFLGGCGNKLKEENELLRVENADWKERATAAEMKASQAESNAANASQQVSALQSQLAARPTPAPMSTGPGFIDPNTPAGNPGQYDSGNNGVGTRNRTTGRSSSRFTLASDISFASGQASLKADAKRELDSIASKIKRNHSGADIIVEGHTDSDPVRKSKYGSNDALSKARADAVRDYLVKQGISRNRIDTVGKGSSEPKGSKAASRRVEIIVTD